MSEIASASLTVAHLALTPLLPPVRGQFTTDDRILVVGMEVAGGMMVSQLAAVAPVTHPKLAEIADFVYCRKRKKTSGTCQQLEGQAIQSMAHQYLNCSPTSPSIVRLYHRPR